MKYLASFLTLIIMICNSFAYSQSIELKNFEDVELNQIEGVINHNELILLDKRNIEIYVYDLKGSLVNKKKMEFNFPKNDIYQIDYRNNQIHFLLLAPYAISNQNLKLDNKEKVLIDMQKDKLKTFDFNSYIFLNLSDGKYLSSTLEFEYLNTFKKGNSLTIIDTKNNSNFSFSQFPEFLSKGFFIFTGRQRFVSLHNQNIYSYFNGDYNVEVFTNKGEKINSIKLDKKLFPTDLKNASSKIKLQRDFIALPNDIKNSLKNYWAVDFKINSKGNIVFIFHNERNNYSYKEMDIKSGKILRTIEIKESQIKPIGILNGKYYYLFKNEDKTYLKNIGD